MLDRRDLQTLVGDYCKLWSTRLQQPLHLLNSVGGPLRADHVLFDELVELDMTEEDACDQQRVVGFEHDGWWIRSRAAPGDGDRGPGR